MPTRIPDPARERPWRKRIARWKASGLTVRDFCEQEGVTPTSFAHWRKEIRDRDARSAGTNQPAFVPVHITPAVAPSAGASPEIPPARTTPRISPIPPSLRLDHV